MNRPNPAFPRSLADLVRPALADALKAQGFAAVDILRRWPEIAGERLAARSMPVRVLWPPRPKGAAPEAPVTPATLVLKVESAFAFEVQMASAQIVERVNAVFGWRCVGALRLRQGPVEAPAPKSGRRAPALDAAREENLSGRLDAIADDGLREALRRLGRGVMAGRPRPAG